MILLLGRVSTVNTRRWWLRSSVGFSAC